MIVPDLCNCSILVPREEEEWRERRMGDCMRMRIRECTRMEAERRDWSEKVGPQVTQL